MRSTLATIFEWRVPIDETNTLSVGWFFDRVAPGHDVPGPPGGSSPGCRSQHENDQSQREERGESTAHERFLSRASAGRPLAVEGRLTLYRVPQTPNVVSRNCTGTPRF